MLHDVYPFHWVVVGCRSYPPILSFLFISCCRWFSRAGANAKMNDKTEREQMVLMERGGYEAYHRFCPKYINLSILLN